MQTFEQYLGSKTDNGFEEIPKKINNENTNELLAQYKEIVLTNIIQQFGLGSIFDLYKRGGNVTTLHNAEKGVFANGDDQKRFEQNYSQDVRKDLYEKDFSKNRKKAFQSKNEIIDDYTGKVLPKDGRAHRDHVVSASEIQQNNAARLFMSDEKRGEMAVDDKNLAWTEGSLNQSKSEHDLVKWMNKDNAKDGSQTNAEYYGIDEEKAIKKYKEARKHVDATIKKEKAKYYLKNTTSAGMKQGIAMGQKQAIGLFIYELQEAIMIEMKEYFSIYSKLKSLSSKIEKFKLACKNIKDRMFAKAKKIFSAFTDGFVSGFIGNILTVFINSFATTAKNVVRVLNEGVYALIKAVKLLIQRPEEMTYKEALFEASKIIAASVVTTFGVILTEGFVTYLKTTPFAPFANVIGGVLGGILTGIVSITVVYSIDHFVEIVNKIKYAVTDVVEGLKINVTEIRENYANVSSMIDEQYKQILDRIFNEYEELYSLTKNAYDNTISSEQKFGNTIKLAEALNVEESKIIRNNDDLLDFFNN